MPDPPEDGPDERSPVAGQYVAYPRPGVIPTYGTPEKLLALYEGHSGLGWIFCVNVVLVLAVGGLMMMVGGSDGYLGLIGFTVLIVAVSSYPFNSKIATGKGWSQATALVVSLLMGLNSLFFCGIIGYIVMQVAAAEEIKRYGLRNSLLGFSRRDVMARIQQLREQQRPVQPF